jgi:hypothetical protein
MSLRMRCCTQRSGKQARGVSRTSACALVYISFISTRADFVDTHYLTILTIASNIHCITTFDSHRRGCASARVSRSSHCVRSSISLLIDINQWLLH